MSEDRLSREEASGPQPGLLDGLTILRYAPLHRERSSGGIDQYLRCLNDGLLERHRLTVLQTHLVSHLTTARLEVETVGMGRILWIPIALRHTESRFADLPTRARYVYDQTLRLGQQSGEAVQSAILNAMKAPLRHKLGYLRHKTVILSDFLSRLLLTHKANLLAIHWLTYDAETLIQRGKKADTPFVLINHFDNAWFSEPRMQKWLPFAAGIGAVSERGMPDHLRSRCVNLSDAVDTEFFAPEKVRPGRNARRPRILLPSRIDKGKGHWDLLQAARLLAAGNVDFEICFAGAVDSESLHQDLRRYVAAAGLEDRVLFLGELPQKKIRSYYALSSVVVLPTYTEGLGRVLLEAQAMQKAVVAYDSGGVGEALLPNDTGFLVQTGDIEALADRIAFVLGNEAERRRLGECGRQFVVGKFSVSALVRRHETFYMRALAGRIPAFSENVWARRAHA